MDQPNAPTATIAPAPEWSQNAPHSPRQTTARKRMPPQKQLSPSTSYLGIPTDAGLIYNARRCEVTPLHETGWDALIASDTLRPANPAHTLPATALLQSGGCGRI